VQRVENQWRRDPAHKLAAIISALIVSGCPSTQRTTAQIERVEVVMGSAASNDFVLHITGRGFGPTSLTYDLSKREGTAVAMLRVEVFDTLDRPRFTVEGERLNVLSPREIDARVMNSPLADGLYGVRLYAGDSNDILVEAQNILEIVGGGQPVDGGVVTQADGGTLDAIVNTPQDAMVADAIVINDVDGGTPDAVDVTPDAEPIDVGPPDAGVVPDAGLGPFQGAFAYRAQVLITNPSNDVAPAGTTFKLTLPHATWVAAGKSLDDGKDIQLFYGNTALEHQWDDPELLETDSLTLVARLPADAPVGVLPAATPLVIYYGDPNADVARSDAVYQFAERFLVDLGGDWDPNGWFRCDFDRPLEANTAAGAGSAYCAVDNAGSPAYRTSLASPNQPNITTAIAANQIYETSFWTAGQMVSQTNDVLYTAYGPTNAEYVATIDLKAAVFVEGAPNVVNFDFPERDGNTRLVDGWRFFANQFQWWQRVRGRFVPTIDQPSLHFRFISKDGTDNAATGVVIDDWTVRLALNPELQAGLGPEEPR
jgi:hypothetical protein